MWLKSSQPWLESLKDCSQFLEDCPSLLTSLAKTLSSPFSWFVCWKGGVHFVGLWGLLVQCSVLSCFTFCFLLPCPPSCVTNTCSPLTPWQLPLLPSVSLFAPPCPIWLSQVLAKKLGRGPQPELGPRQSNSWPWRVRRVSLSVCWLSSVCLSVCPSQTDRVDLVVRHPETSEHWVVFSHQENRGLRLCGTSDLRSDHVQTDAYVRAEALFDCSEPSFCLKLDGWGGFLWPLWHCSSPRPRAARGDEHQRPRLRAHLLRRVLRRHLGGAALLHSHHQPDRWYCVSYCVTSYRASK